MYSSQMYAGYPAVTQQIPMYSPQAYYSQQFPIQGPQPQTQMMLSPSTVMLPQYPSVSFSRAVISAPFYELTQPNPPPGWVITNCIMNIAQGSSFLKYKIEITYSSPDSFIADRQVEVPAIIVPTGWVKPSYSSRSQRNSTELPGIDSIKQTDEEYVYCCTLIYEPEPEKAKTAEEHPDADVDYETDSVRSV